jgi:SAM-dependent methyltransferase
MDDVSKFNNERWNELVRRGVLYSRPYLDLTPETARERIDPFGFLKDLDLRGKAVLCLAGGGGQQSAVFAVLGARVQVIDLTEGMLTQDRAAAAHYGVEIGVHQGDMRDLSRFADGQFDLVWQPYSINFVPNPGPVLREVARVLKPGGYYHLQFSNPFLFGTTEAQWDGHGYPLNQPYVDGAEVEAEPWVFADTDGNEHRLQGPREFRHNLSTMVNELAGLGFVILGLGEEVGTDPHAQPGSWDHFIRVCPPWLTVWCVYRPEDLRRWRTAR